MRSIFFWGFLLSFFLPINTVQATPPVLRHTVRVPFGYELSVTTADQAAVALARSGVLQRAAHWLKTQHSVTLIPQEGKANRLEILEDAVPIAWQVYTTYVSKRERTGRKPETSVEITVTARPKKDWNNQIAKAIKDPLRLYLHHLADEQEQRLLHTFVRLTSENTQQKTEQDSLTRPLEKKFTQISHELRAVDIYRTQLETLTQGQWTSITETEQRLQNALELSPSDALLWHAQGMIFYQQQHTQKALNAFDRAISLRPNFGQALHDRGNAYLRVHLTTLAIEDFTAAIRQFPRKAEFYRSRGSAHLVDEEFMAMCQDFYTACTLGQCDSYHWATSRNKCKQSRGKEK